MPVPLDDASELETWWEGLGEEDREDLFSEIRARATVVQTQHFAIATRRAWARGERLPVETLRKLKRWAR